MIRVEREPEGFGPPYEKCCFCRKPTPTWYRPKDVAVCPSCARRADHEDVPSKEEWCRRERIATPTIGDF